MGLLSFDPFRRQGVLVCDACQRVFTPTGEWPTPRLSELEPQAVAELFRDRPTVAQQARRAGWRVDAAAAACTCPDCLREN